MGRNNKKSKAKNNNTNKQTITQNVETNELPFVSVCTPTYNRRPFIE
jgi:hypothetical protein